MRTRYRAPVLAALLPLVLASLGCSLVQAKAAFKDGNRLYKEENYRKAIEEYEKAVQLKPDFAEAHFYLASSQQSLYRPGKEGDENKMRLDKAIEHYEKSLEVNKGDTPNLQQIRLNTLGALTAIYSDPPLSNYEKALAYAEQLVKDNPNDTKNLYAMANLYEKFNRITEAEQTYEKVAELNPTDAKACGTLAVLLQQASLGREGRDLGRGDEQGRAAGQVRQGRLDARAVRRPRPRRRERPQHPRDVLLGQGLPRSPARRQGEERVRRQGHRGRRRRARDEARLLAGHRHQGPPLPGEGPGGQEPRRAQAVPRPGGPPPEAGDGPAQGDQAAAGRHRHRRAARGRAATEAK